MNKHLINRAMQLFFLVMGSVMWLGIWLTGFDVVHWVLYIPAAALIFAAVTRICPGMILFNSLTKNS